MVSRRQAGLYLEGDSSSRIRSRTSLAPSPSSFPSWESRRLMLMTFILTMSAACWTAADFALLAALFQSEGRSRMPVGM